jgi:RNA polymerase sigma-70 factor (ECF subfamily)
MIAFHDNDASLVAQLQQGDEDAFDSLVRQYVPRFLATARGILRNEEDARDAVQEAMLAVFQKVDSFQGHAAFSSWLHRILINSALMKLRVRNRTQEQPIGELLPAYLEDGHRQNPGPAWHAPDHTPDNFALTQEMKRLVHDKISQLPEDHRSVILLRDIEELDTQAVSELLCVSLGTVKMRLHRARQALRELLNPYMMGDVTA